MSLIGETARYLIEPYQVTILLLVTVVVVSGVGVVAATHQTRQAYSRMQVLEQEQDRLDGEYEKLLLEQSAWASYGRVEEVSREALSMHSPAASDIILVAP